MDRLSDSGLFPKVVLLDTCNYCQLECSMCVHKDMTRSNGFMPVKLYTKLIDEIAVLAPDTRVWAVYFGEALIRKNIGDLIRYAKDKGLTDVVLNSNGLLLNYNNRRKIIDSGLDAIYIGIDAYFAKTYMKLRVGGDFASVNNMVELMINESRQAGHPKVFVQFVEMEENKDEKQLFIDYWIQMGAQVKIRPKVSWAGKIPSEVYVISRYERLPCHWAMQTMSILNNGKVSLCAVDLNGQFIAGDVSKSKIATVWKKMKWIRDAHRDKNWEKLPEFCQKCTDWQMAKSEVVNCR